VLIRRLDTRSGDFSSEFRQLEERREASRVEIEEAVAEILESVRSGGDAALRAAIEQYDGHAVPAEGLWVAPESLPVERALDAETRRALAVAAERIGAFHRRQIPASWEFDERGGRLGQRVLPIERVGLYVPAGTAPLASTVLMLACPAAAAGVPFLAMASPGLSPHPLVLEAARLCGVARILRAGGAHAVAALAFGTESVPRVDKIVGPGNSWVQTAKRQVFGQVGIDAEAGASEVMIVADATAPPAWVAADLLAQAEHDPSSSVVLATPSVRLIDETLRCVEVGLGDLPRQSVAQKALSQRSALIQTRDLDEAVDLANRYGAEHLQLMLEDPDPWLERIRHAGAVFLGHEACVPAGDYIAGPSHVLPTGGTARFFSVVGVEDFQKRMSLVKLSPEVLAEIAPHAIRLAELEGLEGHARSLRVRCMDEPGVE